MARSLFQRLRKPLEERRRTALRQFQTFNPILPGQWRPGMPCHWNETTPFITYKFLLIRCFSLLQFLFGLSYLQFRAKYTIGVFSTNRIRMLYQTVFFLVEVLSFLIISLRTIENWNITHRNSVDFKRIPRHLISPQAWEIDFGDILQEQNQLPSVDVLIPCYNEDVSLVQETVSAALNIDYPAHLLNIYLCDDGNDLLKQSMIDDMSKSSKNLHYVTRPEHNNAKAGNLNHCLRRSSGDFVVILDADFIARPNLVQRMMSYFFVWNPAVEMYELDEKLAAVQTPQQYRNISPYDADLTDQRAIYFMQFILPAKDWYESSPIIGTSNLISRAVLEQVGLFPHYSVTEDTALSLNFHKNGFKTYYVNESLSSGLAPTSLWSSFDQRGRWLKGDWQILFSKQCPWFVEGLTIPQRIMYSNMACNRAQSILNIFYDVACFLLLVCGIEMVDVVDTWKFLSHLMPYFIICSLVRLSRTIGNAGLFKSDAAALAFESMFRFLTLKGLITVLFKGENIKFDVTEKPSSHAEKNENSLASRDWSKNVQRAWFSILMVVMLILSVWRAVFDHAWLSLGNEHSSTPVIMAIGFTLGNLMPHVLCVYLCFIPLLKSWMVKDLVYGRFDQYAVDPMTGKLFVPGSIITVLGMLQVLVVFSSMLLLAILTPKIAPDTRALSFFI